MRKIFVLSALVLAITATADAQVVVAGEDFDGGAVNLISSIVPALDGGPGDYFGVGNRNAWPQGFPVPGVPFSIADDSVIGYSGGGPRSASLIETGTWCLASRPKTAAEAVQP